MMKWPPASIVAGVPLVIKEECPTLQCGKGSGDGEETRHTEGSEGTSRKSR